MKNFIQPANVISYLIPSATTIEPGDVVFIGSLAGVAQGGGTTGDTIAVNLTGAYSLPKDSPLVITQGDNVYWASGGEVTKTVTDALLGVAFADAVSNDAEVVVMINSTANAGPIMANQAAVATADGSDPATTQALANSLKTSLNALLVKLKASGLMIAD